MDIRELRIEDKVSHNGDIGKVIEIKTNHVRLLFKDDTSIFINYNTNYMMRVLNLKLNYNDSITTNKAYRK